MPYFHFVTDKAIIDASSLTCPPAAPGALEAVCHSWSPAGGGRCVSDDLADCGSAAHHGGGLYAVFVSL